MSEAKETQEYYINMKVCSKCKKEKPLTDFYKSSKTKDGFDYRCKECEQKRLKNYRHKHKKEVRERTRKWRMENRDKYNENARNYRNGKRDHYNSLQRQWRKENEEHVSEWRKNNRNQKKARAYEIYGYKCQECGESNPVLFEWHHKKGNTDKKGNVIENTAKIVRRVIKEGRIIEKVQLLCGNCHKLANIKDNTWRSWRN